MQVNSITWTSSNNNTTKSNKTSSSDSSFESFLGESQSLDAIFQKAADKYGVDVNLLKSIGKVESNFRADAVSGCGATGIMQLMPSTAKSLGVKDSTNAEQNIMGGAKYIASLLDKYDGNTKLALAAYNAGSGNVAKYGGIPPFKETQNYVKKVMNYYQPSGSTTNTHTSTTATSPSTTSNSSVNVIDVAKTTNISDQLKAYVDSINNANQTEEKSLIDEILSYDDYLKFMEIFFMDDNEKADDKNNKNNNNVTPSQFQITTNIANMLKQL